MNMEVIYPQLEELYKVITNDFYKMYLEKKDENAKEKLDSEKNNLNIKDKIEQLKIFISKNKTKNINDFDIIQFLSKYIDIIDSFYSKEKIEEIEVQYADQYCLSYIALVFFKFFCDDKEDLNELFHFNINKYQHFSEFITHYSLLRQMKLIYEEISFPVLEEFKIYKDLFINLIKKFDNDSIFYPKSNEGEHEKTENEKENVNKNNIEQFKENDLSTTKTNSEKKEKNGNSEEKKINNDINVQNKIYEINEDMNSSIKKDLSVNSTTKIIKSNINNSENESQENIISKDINKKTDEIEGLKKELNEIKIKTDFDIIDLKIKFIKTQECLEYGNLIFLEYINNEKKKVEYLENYNKSLKNMVMILSNPYSFNFWRKITNIILKNIFIILRNNKFIITQKKDNKVLSQLENYFGKLKTKLNEKFKPNNKYKTVDDLPICTIIKTKLRKYKKQSNSTENITNISQAADKERSYNLIVIYNNSKPDITASLSIDFLFFLKEKGNQIAHFDEKILNFLLFNEIDIIENDEIKIDNEKNNTFRIEAIKEDKKKEIKNNEKKNVTVNKIAKNEKLNKRYLTQTKEKKINSVEENKLHKRIIKSLNGQVKKKSDKIEGKDEIKIDQKLLNNKGKKVIKKVIKINISKENELNEIKDENNNQIKEAKNNQIKEENNNQIKNENYNQIKNENNDPKKDENNNQIKEAKNNQIKEEKNNQIKEAINNQIKEEKNNQIKEEKNNQIKEAINNQIKEENNNQIKEENNNQIKEEKNNQIKEEKNNQIEEENNNQIKEENNKNEKNNIMIKRKLNKKYEGKSKFNGKELVEMLENPIKFQQKILKNADYLFDLRNKEINKFRQNIKYDVMLEEISKFEKEKEFEILILRIRKSINNIEDYIEKHYGHNNIRSLNIKEINDIDLKEIHNNYLKLRIYEKEISNKIKSFESEKKLVSDLQKNIKKYESDINKMINQIKEKLKKESELIRLLDVFDEYKEDLKTKIDNKNKDYLHYEKIFTKQNIDTFTFNDLISFLKKQIIIKDVSYSLIKKDIMNFNLYVEIVTDFNEFKNNFQGNVDLEI